MTFNDEVQSACLVFALAQEIRRVDGSNSLGAAALAEALIPFIQKNIACITPPASSAEHRLDTLCVGRELDSELASGWQPIETAPRDGSKIAIKTALGVELFASWQTTYGGEWRIGEFAHIPQSDMLLLGQWKPLTETQE